VYDPVVGLQDAGVVDCQTERGVLQENLRSFGVTVAGYSKVW
jgi:hypothetical protein